MHYADILAAMTKADNPPTKVARDLKVSPSAVSQVVHGKATSYDIASYISAVTGIPLNRLWPDKRYARAPSERYARNSRDRRAAA